MASVKQDENYEGSQVTQAAEQPADMEDQGAQEAQAEQEAEQKTAYENALANAISSLGSVFESMLPGSLGSLAGQLFSAIADRIESVMRANVQGIRDQETRMIIGEDIPAVTKEVSDVVGIDAEWFNADLAEAADMLGSGRSSEGNQVQEIADAISSSATAYPGTTGQALQSYSDLNEAWLHDHADEYPEAAENMAAVNQAMTESYFKAVMEAEANGLQLSEADREVLDNFHMYGMDLTYEEFVKEYEPEGVQADNPVVRSDGSLEAGIGLDTSEIRTAASSAVLNGSLADARQDKSAMAAWEKTGEDTVNMIREAGPESMGDNYMARIAEMQAYNDAAVSAIADRYADDPEGKAAAEAGLAMRMQAGMGPLFDAMKEDQEAYGCFTDEQLEQLNNLALTGVTVSYDEYIPGTGLYPPEIEAGAEDQVYADALENSGGSITAEEGPAATTVAAAAPAGQDKTADLDVTEQRNVRVAQANALLNTSKITSPEIAGGEYEK